MRYAVGMRLAGSNTSWACERGEWTNAHGLRKAMHEIEGSFSIFLNWHDSKLDWVSSPYHQMHIRVTSHIGRPGYTTITVAIFNFSYHSQLLNYLAKNLVSSLTHSIKTVDSKRSKQEEKKA